MVAVNSVVSPAVSAAYLPDPHLDQAILSTVLYADVFNFPLTERELQHFLIGAKVSLNQVSDALARSAWLATRIVRAGDYWALSTRSALATERQTRDQLSASLWPVARRYGNLLAHVPFVRMVALSGALAMRNAHGSDDDIDYLIVTARGRVWLTRALTVIIVRWVRLWGVRLCPNYVLSETALAQDQHNLYIAHEIAQMVPLAGFDVYIRLRAANPWTADWLPNAEGMYYPETDHAPRGVGRLIQQLGEALLGGGIGAALDTWERRRKLRKFAPKAQTPHTAAQLDAEHVKGHFNDYGYPTLQHYHERLIAHGLPLDAIHADKPIT